MKINWKVRLQKKTFWIAMVAALLALANQVASIFGVDISIYNEQVTNISESIFIVLGLLGIIIDPTTAGLSDSQQAMTYEKPKGDK